MAAFATDSEGFAAQLTAVLHKWQAEAYRFAWLHFPVEKAHLVGLAAAQGFAYHHIEGSTLTMLKRLVPNAEGPPNASHYVGVGGIVINGRNELLTIREKYHDGRPAFYKFPGGFVYPGEHLAAAAVREVWEETDIQTEFHGVVGFRHWHINRFGKSDLYFVCRLTPLSETIQRQVSEIAESIWMPVEQFLLHKEVSAFNRNFLELALKGVGLETAEFENYPGAERRDKIELLLPSRKE